MTNHLIQKVNSPQDLDKLREITRPIIGQLCWRAALTYGDELSLHIGAKLPYSQKSMGGHEKGAWILGTKASFWRLDSNASTITDGEDAPGVVNENVRIVEGSAVTGIDVSYAHLDLEVTFSNDCRLLVLPNLEDPDWDLAYWELFTPKQMVLSAGPGSSWSYRHAQSKTSET